jgi:hypothetical protein
MNKTVLREFFLTSDINSFLSGHLTSNGEWKSSRGADLVNHSIAEVKYRADLADLFFELLSNSFTNEDAFRYVAYALNQEGTSLSDLSGMAREGKFFDPSNLLSLRPRVIRTLFRYGFPQFIDDKFILSKSFREATPSQTKNLMILINLFVLYYGKELLLQQKDLFAIDDRSKLLILYQATNQRPEKADFFIPPTRKYIEKFIYETELDEQNYQHFIETIYLKFSSTPRSKTAKEERSDPSKAKGSLTQPKGIILTWPLISQSEDPPIPCHEDPFLNTGSLVTLLES